MYMDYWESLTNRIMEVSAVDLRCVFGRSLVVFDRTTLSSSLVIRTLYVVILCWSDRPRMWAMETL